MWGFEIYSSSGAFLADLGGVATDRKLNVARNAAGSASFNADSRQLRLLAQSASTTSAGLLAEGRNELRIRKDDRYLWGGQITHVSEASDGVGEDISVQAQGFLELLADRYLEKQRVFTGVEVATILWTVINEMQTASGNFWATPLPSATRATFGITQGSLDTTIGTKDRTYEPGKSVKDILVQMTELQTTETDIEIDYLKRLSVYERMGADKPRAVFELGRNILDYEIPRDATNLVNRAITYGQGAGTTSVVQSIDEDTASQDTYKVRQHIIQMSSVSEEDTLSEHGAGRVAASKSPVIIPKISVDLNRDVTIKDVWPGDRVPVRILDPDLGYQIEDTFRIEAIDLTISNEDTESANLSLSAL